MAEEVVYFCEDCRGVFGLEVLKESVRCPECLGWNAYPVREEDGHLSH